VELADLTKGMRKIKFLEPDFFFCKAGLVRVSQEQCRKKQFFRTRTNCFFFAVPGLTREQQQQQEEE